MKPVSLTIGAVVAALVPKGAEQAGEGITRSGFAIAGRLVEQRRRFRDRGDGGAEKALARVLDPPVAERQLAALAVVEQAAQRQGRPLR